MIIYIGTCGFSYLEWVGPVYPDGTSRQKMLEVYSGMFPAVEIDSTYYRPPSRIMFKRYPERTGGNLKVSMKLHSRFTHEREADESDAEVFKIAIRPLEDSGQFAGFLAQFPQSFRETPENRKYIEKLRELFPDRTVICEFRHEDWFKEDALKFLSALNFPVSTVDEPDMSTLPGTGVVCTGPPAYVRLHGRNYRDWYKGGQDRYTYKYSAEELQDWVKRIRGLAEDADTVYVFFNNHPLGYAATNARELMELLNKVMPKSVAKVPKKPKSEQEKLF
jgi:uncharacterized protein YecE (DUF72 family)